MTAWTIIGTKGCGSVIVEAAFTIAGIPYEREEIDYAQPGPALERLKVLNPLGQVPTLIAPDGAVMTETAAVVLHLDELAPGAGLLPRTGDPLRRSALRWLVFLVAAIYPTWTYGDEPMKWVGEDHETGSGARLRAATDKHRKKLWTQVESQVHGPWFLGAQRSALDLYVCAMTHWRPRQAWFAVHAPKLAAIAARLEADPQLAPLWQREFGKLGQTQLSST